jgi:hypothetical protein
MANNNQAPLGRLLSHGLWIAEAAIDYLAEVGMKTVWIFSDRIRDRIRLEEF